MKKVRKVCIFTVRLLMMLVLIVNFLHVGRSTSLADDAVSLDEIVESSTSTQANENNNSNSSNNNRSTNEHGFFGEVGKSLDFNETSEQVTENISKFREPIGNLFQYISYFLLVVMILRVLVDLAYLLVPFIRPLLDGGMEQGGNMNSNNENAGGYGYSGGYGGNYGGSYGGNYGSRYGGGGYGNHNNMGEGNRVLGNLRGRRIASNAVIRAVNLENNGKKPYMTYGTDMAIMLIAIPVLLVLSMTGAIVEVGFALGGVIAEVARGFTGGI